MRQAAEAGKAQLSGKVTLMQETAGPAQAGLLMYVPVYRSGAQLTNAKERFDALRGFVYSPYRVTDLMSGILDGRKLQIDFALFSGAKADPEQQLFVSDPRVASGQVAIRQASLQLFGQNWTFSFYAQPGFFKRFHQTLEKVEKTVVKTLEYDCPGLIVRQVGPNRYGKCMHTLFIFALR